MCYSARPPDVRGSALCWATVTLLAVFYSSALARMFDVALSLNLALLMPPRGLDVCLSIGLSQTVNDIGPHGDALRLLFLLARKTRLAFVIKRCYGAIQ